VKVVIPHLLLCFDQLNLIADESIATRIDVTGLDLEENIVVVGVSIEKSS
jgi:hypothetical protein